MGRGQGAYIRIQNKSSQEVTVKLQEGRKIQDDGLDTLEGALKVGAQFPATGKTKYGGGTYAYIEGEVKNRFQKDGYFHVSVNPSDGTPSSTLTLVVDHDSWEAKDKSPDKDSSVLLVADVSDDDDDDDFKIELRIYDNYNPMKWMEEFGEKHGLGTKPFCQIGLPGTHDSGTYRFNPELGASPDNGGLMKLDDILDRGRLLGKLNDYILGQVFERLCQCQSMSIRQQLEAGIRYIDLRVAYHAASDSYHTCHGVYCVNVQEILQDIKGFMDENPKEIVIIEFKKLYGMEDAQYTALAQMIMDTLGDKMTLKNSCPADATVQTYWDAGYQAVVLYQHNPTVQEMGDHKLWPLHKLDSPWPNAGTTEELHATLQEKVASHNPSKFFCAQGILTPDAEVIQREVLKGDGLSIRKLSQQCAPKVIDWVEEEWKPEQKLNIVIVDFTEIGNLVPSVINYNHSL